MRCAPGGLPIHQRRSRKSGHHKRRCEGSYHLQSWTGFIPLIQDVSMAVSILRKVFIPNTRVPRQSPGRTLGVESLEARWAPAVLTVGSGQQYATINAALTAANPGDTINVYPG